MPAHTTVQLSAYTVGIKGTLSYWDMEEINAARASAAKLGRLSADMSADELDIELGAMLLAGKRKMLQVSIVSITDKEGKPVQFSEQFLRSLTQEDGAALEAACAAAQEKKS